MRYDTEVAFCRKIQGEYNARTGNYEAGYTLEHITVCSVTDMSEERQIVLFGSIMDGACVVRTQSHVDEPFDTLQILCNNKTYVVKRSHRLRKGDVFFCVEAK